MKHKSLLFALPMVATMSLTSCSMDQKARGALWHGIEEKLFNVGSYYISQEKVFKNIFDNYGKKFKITLNRDSTAYQGGHIFEDLTGKTETIEHYDFENGYYDSNANLRGNDHAIYNVGQIVDGVFYHLNIAERNEEVSVYTKYNSSNTTLSPIDYMNMCFYGRTEDGGSYALGIFGIGIETYVENQNALSNIFKEEASVNKQVGNYVFKYEENAYQNTKYEIVFDSNYCVRKIKLDMTSGDKNTDYSHTKWEVKIESVNSIDYLDYSEYIK